MKYELINIQEFNIAHYLEANSNTYAMLVTGSCNYEQRRGSFRTALFYNKYAKVYEAIVNDTTSANYCMLQGISQTIDRIKYKDTRIQGYVYWLQLHWDLIEPKRERC